MLDDPAALRAVDKGDMLGALRSLPAQVTTSAAEGQRLQPRSRGPFRSLLFTAMGGSAMGADMAAMWLGARGGLAGGVVRGYAPPAWAGQGTLVVAVSYSGDTEETLACARAAQARGAHVLAVTSGGELARWAEASGGEVVRVPPGLQPRAALGHLTFAALGALGAMGLAKPADEPAQVAAHLDALRLQLEPASPEARNPAKRLARALHHKLAFIYGAGALEVAARRFATQLNENPKVLAHWGPVPEVHHNELSAWFADARIRDAVLPVLLTGEPSAPLRARERASLALLREAGAEPFVVEAQGPTDLARAFHAIYVGDFASVYLACLLGRDPTPVDAIRRLKARMAEFRGG